MQKHRLALVVFAILLSLSLAFTFGCAKKAAVKETESAQQKAEADARDKAAKEAQIREQERAAAEKEQAGRKQAAEAVSPIAAFEYIYFDYDKFAVKPESRETLRKLADWLNAKKDAKLAIEGNCDERGTVEYNLALGERRANAARDYLVTLGVDKNRLSTVSYGKEKPVDPGHDEAAWAKNRNAHFVVK